MQRVCNSSKIAALTAAVLLAATTFLPGQGQAQANCQWYATTALKQQQDNERLKCGFTGPAWNSDLKAHTAWCSGVAPEMWRQEAQKRDQELAACQAKKK